MHPSEFSLTFFWWALALGGLSALSLPLGSVVGIVTHPKPIINSALAAFGAGALLAALSVELVAPTMMEAVEASVIQEAHHPAHSPYLEPLALIAGAVIGGILFVLLDQLVNRHGGYLRKTATAINYMRQRNRQRNRVMIRMLGSSRFLMSLKPEDVQTLFDCLRPAVFAPGEKIFQEGEPGDKVYFVESGNIQLFRNGKYFITLGEGEIIGEIAVIVDSPRHANAFAEDRVKAWVLSKRDFDRLRRLSPELEAAALKIASERLEDQGRREKVASQDVAKWARNAAKAVREGGSNIPTAEEVRHAASQHTGAPLAIWLGIFLDGIPESFVIGASFLFMLTERMAHGVPSFGEVIPYTLIAGLFLSNFPEAMSSSAGMRNQGWRAWKVLMLWVSLMVMTALGAGIGYTIGADVSHVVEVGLEGLAAGAMLTMIAQTMIPEAVHLGGPTVVGLSTLMGFLGAIAFKLLEM